MGFFDRLRRSRHKANIELAQKSLFQPDPNEFCNDCKRSVKVDDTTEASTMERFESGISFKEEIHYKRRDTMPNLDRLLSSANAGCNLCRFLRQTILNEHGSDDSWKTHSEELVLSFFYTWRMRSLPNGWLPSLDELTVNITHPNIGTIEAVSFHVSAHSGKSIKCSSIPILNVGEALT
jgi:hypothetical protein